MKIHGLVAIVMFFLLGVPAAFTQSSKTMTSSPIRDTIPLTDALGVLGHTYNCFFTIEDRLKPSGTTNVLELESALVRIPSGKKNIQGALSELSKTVPNFSYRVDKSNPRLIHIIDAALLRQAGYGLDVRLKSIQFTGTVDTLVDVMKKQGAPVSQEAVLVTSEAAIVDYRTVVKVRGRGLTVRDALSNFVSLDKRSSRIIWIARTNPEPRAISYIRFLS